MDRLDFIASLSSGLNSVVDCGCDHAYTLINCVKKYGVKMGLGLDVNASPLAQAKKNVIENHLEDSIELELADGLTSYNGSYEGLIISGMGGSLISEILDYDTEVTRTFKKLILSPHNDAAKVRFFLINNNFRIVNEYMIEENNHIYEIIVATNEKLDRKYDFYDMKFGPILRKEKCELFVKKYTELLNQTNKALENAKEDVQVSRLKMTKAMLEEILA